MATLRAHQQSWQSIASTRSSKSRIGGSLYRVAGSTSMNGGNGPGIIQRNPPQKVAIENLRSQVSMTPTCQMRQSKLQPESNIGISEAVDRDHPAGPLVARAFAV
jgi:hypothetical protein